MHADDVCRRTRPSTPPYTPTRLLTSTPQHPLATNQRSVRRHRYRQHCTFQHPTLLLPTLINHNHQPQGVSHRDLTVKKSYQRPAQVSVTLSCSVSYFFPSPLWFLFPSVSRSRCSVLLSDPPVGSSSFSSRCWSFVPSLDSSHPSRPLVPRLCSYSCLPIWPFASFSLLPFLFAPRRSVGLRSASSIDSLVPRP